MVLRYVLPGFVVLAGLGMARVGCCQEHVSVQTWIDFNPSWQLGPNLELYGDVGLRAELNRYSWLRFVAQPRMRYTMGAWRLSGGVSSFYTWNDIIADRWELRLWQGGQVTWPRGAVPLTHYVRLEQRFDFNTSTWDVRPSLRVRYQLATRLTLAARPGAGGWYARAYVEGFATLAGEKGQFNEHLRVMLGLERVFNPRWSGRFEATWRMRDRQLSFQAAQQLYLRLRLFHRFGAAASQ